MNISRNSWHYRVSKFYGWTPSKSLCVYFWQVIASLMISCTILPGSLAVLIGVMFVALPTILGGVLWNYTSSANSPFQSWDVFLLSISTGYGCILIIFLVIGLFEAKRAGYILKWTSCIFKTKENVEKQPSLVVEWVKAKKSKVCPIITFKD